MCVYVSQVLNSSRIIELCACYCISLNFIKALPCGLDTSVFAIVVQRINHCTILNEFDQCFSWHEQVTGGVAWEQATGGTTGTGSNAAPWHGAGLESWDRAGARSCRAGDVGESL